MNILSSFLISSLALSFSACQQSAISSSSPISKTPQTAETTKVVPAPTISGLSLIPLGRPDPQGRKNLVISPYKPYNLIDIKGYKSGDIVGDPSTAKVDANGKIIPTTAKHFRIP